MVYLGKSIHFLSFCIYILGKSLCFLSRVDVGREVSHGFLACGAKQLLIDSTLNKPTIALFKSTTILCATVNILHICSHIQLECKEYSAMNLNNVMNWGPTMLSFNEHENPHFDYEYNTHLSFCEPLRKVLLFAIHLVHRVWYLVCNCVTYMVLRCKLGYTADQQLHRECHLITFGIQVHLLIYWHDYVQWCYMMYAWSTC